MANTSPTAQRPASQDAKSPARPVARYQIGNVSAAVFTDSVKKKNGDTFDVFNVSLRRSYKKADGSLANSHSLRSGDLLSAIEALQKCHTFIAASEDGNLPGGGEQPEQ